jgi:Ti-type conjugative transfer relaxase TraA
MATYHFSMSQKGAGNSGAVIAAAYRHGAKMKNELTGVTKDYSDKDEVVHTEISLPEDAPDWAKQEFAALIGDSPEARMDTARVSEKLWNAVELANTRLNRRPDCAPRFALSLEMSLPVELSRAENIELVRDFVANHVTGKGMIADWVYHDLDENPHVHLLGTVRELSDEGWGALQRDWRGPSFIRELRFAWAQEVNFGLERAGLTQRVDHRSYEDQGIELKVVSYDPNVANNAEATGEVARGKVRAAEARAYNEAFLKEKPEHILVVLGARQTVFTQDNIRMALMERMGGGVDDLDALMSRVMASHELVQLDALTPRGEVQYTTRARVTLETNLVVDAMELASQRLDVDGSKGLELLSPELRRTQRSAAEAMVSPARLTMVTGFAGTGKTYTLHEVAKVWQSRGYEVIGGAASGKATQEMSGIVGMEAASLAAWEARWARGRVPEKKFVFVMDEAGMVGSDVWARVQGQVAAMGGKLIAVGDPEQLQPVNDTSAFLAVQERIGVTVMDEIVRQNNPLEREASRGFALGKAEAKAAIGYYAGAGNVHFVEGANAAISGIVGRYFEGDTTPENRVAVALSNKDVWALNTALRGEAVERGVVTDTRNFGEIIRIERGYDKPDRRVSVPLDVGAGDRLMFTAAHRSLGIPKSSLGTVTGVRAGEIDLVVDGTGRSVTVDMSTFRDFDYGFATTIHKSQGMTVDKAFVLGHQFMNQHLVYVAMTRHRDSVEFFAPTDRVEDMAALEKIVQQKGYLNFPIDETPSRILERAGAGFESEGFVQRADFKSDSQPYQPVAFEGDAHLAGVVGRVAGLLSSEYIEGDPFFDKDPRGYADNATGVIDDLIERRSAFGAADVANALSGVVKEPETFVRLFREAMEHPDLIVLRDEAGAGGARVYTTRAQVTLELDVVDRGARLALLSADGSTGLQAAALSEAKSRYDLTDAQSNAIDVASKGQFNIISGESGSGKSRVAAALGDAHAQSDWNVFRVAPTGVGVDNMRRAGSDTRVLTLSGLEYVLGETPEDTGFVLGKNTVVILDEASLVGAKTAERLLARVEEGGAKLIALRDNDQLNPYEAAPIFQTLEARIGGTDLGTSQRSLNIEVNAAVRAIAASEMEPASVAKGLLEAGVLQGGGTRAASIARLAADFVSDPSQDKVALAHSRADVGALNAAIRAGLDKVVEGRTDDLGSGINDGSLGDLRIGDQILLSKSFKHSVDDKETGKPQSRTLRAGTGFEVERATEAGVVLRSGAGNEAQYLKFTGENADFEYRFGFATTVHGSKGRSIDNVHMLGTPGMSRRVFYTGAALHRRELNVVLPTSQDNVEKVTRAILQTDDSARSVLDYGFEAALHAREALQSGATPLEHEPSKLVDGFDRMIDWVADRLDGGSDRVEPPTRAVRLRAAVVAELIAAKDSGRDDMGAAGQGASFTAQERQKLERSVDGLINRRSWGRLLGVSDEGRAMTGKSDAPAKGSAQDQMVARILERGATASVSSKDDGLREWFVSASKALEARDGKSLAPALVPEPTPERTPEMDYVPKMSLTEEGVESVQDHAAQAKLTNLARAFTSAVSKHIEYENPVHVVDDLQGDIRRLLEGSKGFKVDDEPALDAMARGIAMKRRIVDVKLEVIEDVRVNDERGYGAARIKYALYENKDPFNGISGINGDKYKSDLAERIKGITPESQEPEQVDYDAAKVMMFAQIKQPELLSVASAVVEASGYEQVFEQHGATIEAARTHILEKLSIENRDPSLETKEQRQQLLDRVYTAFTRKEIGAFINGEQAAAKSLPKAEIDPKLVKETLAKLNSTYQSKAAPRHTSGSLDGLNKQVQAQALTQGIGFGR